MGFMRVRTYDSGREWLVDTETRRIAPAEGGEIGVSHPLCLDDFRESGKTAVTAYDGAGHEWILNLETFTAFPAISGGEGDDPTLTAACPRHGDTLREVTTESDLLRHLCINGVSYCPVPGCDYVTWPRQQSAEQQQIVIIVAHMVAFQEKAMALFERMLARIMDDGR